MKVLQYRGKIEDFNQNVNAFESYMSGEEAPSGEVRVEGHLMEGKATPEGTARYKARSVDTLNIPARNFRKPFPLPIK